MAEHALMLRLRLRLRRWLHRPHRERATPDPLAAERRTLDGWQLFLDALAGEALAGNMNAAVKLSDLAEDRIGEAKRRMARVALEELLAARTANKAR
jgi:hypothetical protein